MGWQGVRRRPATRLRPRIERHCFRPPGDPMHGQTPLKILAAIALLGLAACTRSDPETALREQLAGLHAAIEAREPSAVQAYLAEDFVGPGGLDREGARRTAMLVLSRHRNIGVTFGPLDVAMQQPRNATIRFQALATGGDGSLLPGQVQAYDVTTAWRETDGEWRMVHADWTPRL